MTAKCALAKAFLDGRTLNVKNCFDTIGLTNCAREVSRMIEQPFGVELKRIKRDGKSRYGQPVTWYDYRLERTEENKKGIAEMRIYVAKQLAKANPKTDKQLKQLTLI